MAIPKDSDQLISHLTENWRDDPHPFYRLLQRIINGEEPENLASLEPNEEFWGQSPPKEIILATGSIRKALMMSLVLNKVSMPFDHPMELQSFFSQHIHNGDGSLTRKAWLGSHQGVPVYAESAAAGESERNDPSREARNKVDWLARQYPYNTHDYLFITTDAVDFVDWDGNGKQSGDEGLGKPTNTPGFPQQTGENDEEYQRRLAEFEAYFIQENFIPGLELIHVNGVALLEVLANVKDPREVKVWEILIHTTITTKFLSEMEVYPDQGGGGASQQNHDWESAARIFATLDDETQTILRPVLERDPRLFKALVFFQINGMPVMNILQEIERWAASKKAGEIAGETVVFASENQ